MPKETTKGKCGYYSKVFAGIAMTRHLKSCKASPYRRGTVQKSAEDTAFLIKASGKGLSDYWLFLEVDENATMKELDSFLRKTWPECCGHISCFIIGNTEYEVYLDKGKDAAEN